MQTATPQQVRLLQHTLGLCEHQRSSYRNHFVAGPGHHDMPDLEVLENLGLMGRHRAPSFCDPTDIVFYTTEAGQALALEQLPEPPPPEKQTQYRQWLDADTGCTFREWLCGSRLPKFETRGYVLNGTQEYRMYRMVWDGDWDSYRDVQGQWANTKKEAKASYKAALKAHQQSRRAQAQQKGPQQ
ncbi:hypothetical protein HMPREF9701_04966 [Delftia acidovorans CCUG 274B]|uniref:hypothetical protein n=1 Tax=Delftia acidovorans TaxID=80866 RepID=UPI000353C32D|nr:hypothetical protein [Delftia acidovorans]EPD35933.1 hypothetical protein HMPREF9701_04966 [Delftia acidovorans CCUG 274B]